MRNKYMVIVVGTGGTGSFVVKELAHYVANSGKEMRKNVSIHVMDGDVLEEKNLNRQCFFPDNIGDNKAHAMAVNVSESKGIPIGYTPAYLTQKEQLMQLIPDDSIPVLIGCVDNVACRKVLSECFQELPTCFYIDSGNGFDSGQCVAASKYEGMVISPTIEAYPIEMEDDGTEGLDREHMSCEMLNVSAPQHVLTNLFAGLEILKHLIPLLKEEHPIPADQAEQFAGQLRGLASNLLEAAEVLEHLSPCSPKKDLVASMTGASEVLGAVISLLEPAMSFRRGLNIFKSFQGTSVHYEPEDFGFQVDASKLPVKRAEEYEDEEDEYDDDDDDDEDE